MKFNLYILFLLFSCSYKAPLEFSKSIPKISNSHIVIIGDTQKTSLWEFWRERNNKYRKIVLNEIAKQNPLLVLHLGDLVFQGSSEAHWAEFDEHAKRLYEKNIPILPTLGNHEYFGSNKTALEYYFTKFPITENKKWYSIIVKKTAFIMLNSNFDELSKKEINNQKNWFLKKLKLYDLTQNIDNIIVSCHEPPYTNSTVVSDNFIVQNQFVKPFNKSKKTKLFLSGHSHAYEHFLKNGKHFIVSGGGGGPRQKTDIVNGTHLDLYNGDEVRPLHYIILNINKKLEVKIIKYNSHSETFSVGDYFSI